MSIMIRERAFIFNGSFSVQAECTIENDYIRFSRKVFDPEVPRALRVQAGNTEYIIGCTGLCSLLLRLF